MPGPLTERLIDPEAIARNKRLRTIGKLTSIVNVVIGVAIVVAGMVIHLRTAATDNVQGPGLGRVLILVGLLYCTQAMMAAGGMKAALLLLAIAVPLCAWVALAV